jgi:hypothetical protein
MDPASTIGPKARNFLSNEDTPGLAPRFFIGTTRTARGLTVICVRDDTEYGLAKKVSDEDFAAIKLVEIAPFESWNYCILPR